MFSISLTCFWTFPPVVLDRITILIFLIFFLFFFFLIKKKIWIKIGLRSIENWNNSHHWIYLENVRMNPKKKKKKERKIIMLCFFFWEFFLNLFDFNEKSKQTQYRTNKTERKMAKIFQQNTLFLNKLKMNKLKFFFFFFFFSNQM